MVETITGGFAGGSTSNKAKKRQLRTVMNTKNKRRKEHYEPISFTKEDYGDIEREHDDPMVVFALIHNFLVKRVLIDQGSSGNILYSHATQALGIPKCSYKPYNGMLVGFAREQVQVEGNVKLQVRLDS